MQISDAINAFQRIVRDSEKEHGLIKPVQNQDRLLSTLNQDPAAS